MSIFKSQTKKSAAPQPRFEFVDGRPQTTEEKAKTKTQIRSTARKWQLAQRQKQFAEKEDTGETIRSSSTRDHVVRSQSVDSEDQWNSSSDITFEGTSEASHVGMADTTRSWDQTGSAYTTSSRGRRESSLEAYESSWGWGSSSFVPRQDLVDTEWPDRSVVIPSQPSMSWGQLGADLITIEEESEDWFTTSDQVVLASPFNPQGAAQHDPFATYPSKLPATSAGKYVHVLAMRHGSRNGRRNRGEKL